MYTSSIERKFEKEIKAEGSSDLSNHCTPSPYNMTEPEVLATRFRKLDSEYRWAGVESPETWNWTPERQKDYADENWREQFQDTRRKIAERGTK